MAAESKCGVDGILRTKALSAFLLAAMAMTSMNIVLSVGGVILEHIYVAQGSLGESPVRLQTIDGGAFGVVTYLEASFCRDPSRPVALAVSPLVRGCFHQWRGKAGGAGGWLDGVDEPSWR